MISNCVRFLRVITLAVAVSFVFPPQAGLAKSCSTVTANGVGYWYPFVYRNTEGVLTGIIVDGAQEALARIGVTLDIAPGAPWKRLLKDFDNGDIDMVFGAYWKAERAAKYLYSEPLGREEIRVFVKAGREFPLSAFEDLKGRHGLRLLGGSLGQKFDAYAEQHLEFSTAPTNDRMIQMLAAGRADFGIQGHKQGLHFADVLGLSGQVTPLAWPILTNDVHLLINRKAACATRVPALNIAIKAMEKEGYLDQLVVKHLGQKWGGNR